MGLVLCVGIWGCLAGDLVWFEAGRRWGSHVMRILCGFTSDPNYCAERAHLVFGRWGLRSLIVAKFIPGLDGVTPPLAGIEGSSRIAFLAYDSLGSLLWSALYAGLGYVFANDIVVISASIARSGNVLAVAIGVPLACYVCWRAWVMAHMLRHLRLRRVTPLLLHKRLKSGEKVAIIDLLRFEEEQQDRAGIAGAVRIHPARLRNRFRVLTPDNLDIVLYCSSAGEFTSARVAIALQKKGVSNVWLLEGGLAAWKNEGFPVTFQLSTPSEAAERLGIKIIETASGPWYRRFA